MQEQESRLVNFESTGIQLANCASTGIKLSDFASTGLQLANFASTGIDRNPKNRILQVTQVLMGKSSKVSGFPRRRTAELEC